MAHKFVLLVLSLCASSIGVSAFIPLDLLSDTPTPKPEKTTTTTPPPPPDPILTGARTATDRTAIELPPDIIFGNAQSGGSAADAGTNTATEINAVDAGPPGQDLNLDIDKFIREALGNNMVEEPGTPKQTDMTAFLDLIGSEFFTPASSQSELQKALNSISPTAVTTTPKPTAFDMPGLGSLIAANSKTESSVGIPVSMLEPSNSIDSQMKDTPTVRIPENSIPLDFPSFQSFPSSPSVPETPPLPPSSPTQTSTDTSGSSGLPPLPNTPGLPPFSQMPSFSQPSELPSPPQTHGLPPLTETSRSSDPFSPPSFTPQAPQSQLPSQSFQGLPRGPFTSSIPSDANPPGLNLMRGPRNPFQAASQLLDRVNNRGIGPSNTGGGQSGATDTNALSDAPLPSNDPSLLPFAENVLSQVQQLVNRLKDNRDGPSVDQTTDRLPSTANCPNGQPRCPEDPCHTSSCLNIINAQCRPSCTECAPRYFVNDRDVTEMCTIISGLRPASGGANLAPGGRGAHLFMGNNGEFLNIPTHRRPGPAGNGPIPPPRGIPPIIDPLTRQQIDPMFLEQLENRRMVDPRMEQPFAGNGRGGPPSSRFFPGGRSPNIDPRFLRALVENENIARLRNRQNRPPFDPRVGRFVRPGAAPVDLQQIARARGQNLDIAAVRRFAAEQGLSGTVNLGGPATSNRLPPQSAIDRTNRQNDVDRTNRQNAIERINRQNAIERFNRQNAVERINRQNAVDILNRQFTNGGIASPRAQGLPTGNSRIPPQISGLGNPTAVQPPTGLNEQHLQELITQFTTFQTRQTPNSANNQPQNSGPNVPGLSIQSAQNNPLRTIQAAMRQFQRQVRAPGRSPSNVI